MLLNSVLHQICDQNQHHTVVVVAVVVIVLVVDHLTFVPP